MMSKKKNVGELVPIQDPRKLKITAEPVGELRAEKQGELRSALTEQCVSCENKCTNTIKTDDGQVCMKCLQSMASVSPAHHKKYMLELMQAGMWKDVAEDWQERGWCDDETACSMFDCQACKHHLLPKEPERPDRKRVVRPASGEAKEVRIVKVKAIVHEPPEVRIVKVRRIVHQKGIDG